MEPAEIDIANWLRANGIDGDAAAATALFSALDRPGDYGAIAVERTGEGLRVTGPAGSLAVFGAADIQAFRLRLQEIMTHPGQAST